MFAVLCSHWKENKAQWSTKSCKLKETGGKLGEELSPHAHLSGDGAWGHSQIMVSPPTLHAEGAGSPAVPAEGGNTEGQLCISHCKASFRENSWQEPSAGFCRAGVPWKIPTQHCPQTPHSSCLSQSSPREILTHAQSAFTQNQTGTNSCSGEAFNEKLNSMILKVFSNLNGFFD